MAMPEELNVVDLLLEQHDHIRVLFNDVAMAQGEEKLELFDELVRLLAAHESVEEEVVHPTARRRIDDGDDIVEARLEEEDEIKQALADLYDLGVDHPDFDGRLQILADMVIQHVTDEENEEFSVLRETLEPGELRRMTGALQAAEAVAPIRAHPMADEAAIGPVSGPPPAMFDRAREAIRDWQRTSG